MADHRGQRDNTADGGQQLTTEDGDMPMVAHQTAISNPPPPAFLHSITAIERFCLGSPLAIICNIWSLLKAVFAQLAGTGAPRSQVQIQHIVSEKSLIILILEYLGWVEGRVCRWMLLRTPSLAAGSSPPSSMHFLEDTRRVSVPLLRCNVAPGRLGMPMGMRAASSFLGGPKADVRAGLPFFLRSGLTDNDIADLGLRNRLEHRGYVEVPERGELHPEVDVQAELNGSYNPSSMVRCIDKALEHCKHDMDLRHRAPL